MGEDVDIADVCGVEGDLAIQLLLPPDDLLLLDGDILLPLHYSHLQCSAVYCSAVHCSDSVL